MSLSWTASALLLFVLVGLYCLLPACGGSGAREPSFFDGGTVFQVWVGLGKPLSSSDGGENLTSSEIT